MSQVEEPPLDMSPDLDAQKPLPTLPIHPRRQSSLANNMPDPSLPIRPRMDSINSFQQKRKKVPWKGKNCIISLPMTDRESAGLPPVLSPDDVRTKLEELRAQGHSTRGFDLTVHDGASVTFSQGQSRVPYPDTEDMHAERQMRSFKVYIPDQSEWQRWVEYLQEEKLRALGVTSSDSEPPLPGPSPLSASLSRTSSRFPGPISPPIGTSSAASNPLRATSNPFSPPFSTSSSQANGFSGPMHGYKGSLAFLPGQNRMMSPVDLVSGQTSPFISGARRSPLNAHARRPTSFSPVNPHAIQSLDQVLSPQNAPAAPRQSSISPQPIPESASYFPFQRSQTAQSGPEPALASLRPPMALQQSVSLPRTPNINPSALPPIEIQHPTPRSHRHNLSAALQKEIDDAEAHMERQDARRGMAPRLDLHAQIARKTAQVDEDEELPILRRPETILDDQSDIVTNPSIAGTPLLSNDKNPFSNWQALSDAARGDRLQPESSHKKQPSQSKFNVEAKEFDPTAAFKSSNFTASFTPFATSFKPSAPTFRPAASSRPSLARLNVEAQPFVPGGTVMSARETTSTVKATPFRFSSAAFNVDAPAFNPVLSKDPPPVPKVAGEGESVAPRTSIFGDVKIELGTQATRRNKALPIVRPRSKDGPPSRSSSDSEREDEYSEEDDEDGRPPIPTDRAKRARTVDSDGDRSPVYADSAPFNNTRILSEIVNDAAARQLSPGKTRGKPVDGWSYIPAESDDDVRRAGSPLPSDKGLSGRDSPFQIKDESTRSTPNRAHSPTLTLESEAPEDMALSPARASPESRSHGPRSSLSALAAPFEFKPSLPATAPASTPGVTAQAPITSNMSSQSKMKGLMASRYAKSPTPQPASPTPMPREVSPALSLLGHSSDVQPGSSIKVSQTIEDTATSEVEDIDKTDVSRSLDAERELLRDHSLSSGRSSDSRQESLLSPMKSGHEPRNAPNLSLASSRYASLYEAPSFASPAYVPGRKELPKVEFSDDGDDLMPSFEEIDAVMKQFENNPELGIERNDSPVQSTPLVDMRLGNNFRSDAPSPSPRRVDRHPLANDEATNIASFGLGLGIHKLNTGKEEISDWNDAISSTEDVKLQSRAQFFDGHVNDLVDGILENRLGPLERTLQTIQHSISLMATRPASKRRSLSSDAKESDADDEDEHNAIEGYSSYRSRSPDAKRYRKTSRIRAAVAEGMAQYRDSAPPVVAVPMDFSQLLDELAELKDLTTQNASSVQFQSELASMRELLQHSNTHVQQKDLKKTLEDVIASHPRLRGSRAEQDHGSSAANVKLQLDGLEAMLKVEQERAEHEARLRKQKEDEILELRRQLQETEDEAAGHREATEMAEGNLRAFVQEKEAYQALQQDVQKLNLIIDEQEENLKEYRRYKEDRQEDLEQLRESNRDLTEDLDLARKKTRDISHVLEDERHRIRDLTDDLDNERDKTKELTRTLWDVKDQLKDRDEASNALHAKTEQLRNEIVTAARELGAEQAEWRQREHELLTKMTMMEGALDSATRRQEKAEVDHDYVAKQLKDALAYKDRFDRLQLEISDMQQALASQRAESVKHEDHAYRLERELEHVRESKSADIATATARLQAEAEGTRSQLEGLRSDTEARISRLQARLDTAEIDLEDHKAKYDSAMSEAEEARKQALQEQSEKHDAALEEQTAGHGRHLADLRERHTRAMHNSSDDRHRLEHHYNEKIALGEDKIKHLEGKVADLEDRLEVSKSAARAAVEAAMAKGANLPTPAASVVASPPHRAQSASISLVKGTELPEKIPVQSLRESIMVLQDQLQNREQKIEKLEAELAAIDKEAPNKVKAYESEAGWLRELLGVRIEEIEDIVKTLSKADYDREEVKDAAIRLKANIQMEQQLRERAANNGGPLAGMPTLSSLASHAQSPRTALPLAAAAAWGNFVKARDVSMNTLGQLATDYASTPSRPGRTVSPAHSWSSGVMTPPNTVQRSGRTASGSDASSKPPPPSMRPLAAAAAARKLSAVSAKSSGPEARPLRAFSSQPRALRTKLESVEGRDPLAEAGATSGPLTPTTNKGQQELDVGEDVDDDASPLDAKSYFRPFDDIDPRPINVEDNDSTVT